MNEGDWAGIEQALASDDADRYVSTFFAPAGRRRALIALYAFDHEVSRIGAVAREPMAGHIRLAWWREQVDAIFADGRVDAPVPRALAEAVQVHGLPQNLFDAYWAARALDLEEAPFPDEAALEAHAVASAGGILQLAARVLGAEHRADQAARLAGIACTAATHARDLAFFASRRRCRIPVAWLGEARLNAEDVFAAREMTPGLRLAIARLGAKAGDALAALNATRFPRVATAALAPATLSRWATRRGFDPFRPREMPAWQRVARLSLANLTWRF